MVNVGPLKPISVKAIKALDKIAKILKETPKDEWIFVLKFSEEKAEKMLNHKK